MEEQKFEIDISSLFQIFNDHLNIKNNARILFSGKFGIGKTWFLKKFLKNKEDKYKVFHLFPINYQISSNENIIDFLKYDILIELLDKGNIFNDEDNLNKNFIAFIKAKRNTNSFLKGTIENSIELLPGFLGKLGKPLKTALKIDKEFKKFKKEGDKILIEEFLEKNNSETDIVSQIIKNKIENNKNNKKSVLILDDLERIDPEHIFRILNIFSAHYDLHNDEIKNKFGFDKIILVADIQNIKSIFHHRYGNNTDFNGYFNKFFSIEVFQFQNEEIIKNAVDQIISEFQIADDEELKRAIGQDGFLRFFIEDILKKSLKIQGKEKLNLRQLLKGIKFPLNAFKRGLSGNRFVHEKYDIVFKIINLTIAALISIFGGLEEDLLSVIKKIKPNNNENKDYAYKMFSKYLLLKISPYDDKTEETTNRWSNYTIKIKRGKITNINNQQGDVVSTEFLFFKLLTEYIEKKHYLKDIK